MTRILVLHYSQTGQLTRALEAMMAPLAGRADVEIVWQTLEPAQPYPFPWPFLGFFDIFPEAVYMDGPPLKPMQFDADSRFDLVVLGYQVWFLSPSLPLSAFLASSEAQVLRNTPVITFIACRNMWLSAQEKVKARLQQLGTRLIDNIVLVDRAPPWATFVTTPWWVLTGNKNPFPSLLPPARVSEADIRGASRFGRALAAGLSQLPSGRPLLHGLGAVKVNPRYVAGEQIAHRSFRIWGRLLRAIGKPGDPARRAVLILYILFLIAMILTVLPISIVVRALLRPLLQERLQEQVRRLEQPSGSSRERLAEFSQ